VVINHIHDDVNACFGIVGNQLLKLLNPGRPIVRIARINAFRSIIVERIIARVESPVRLVVRHIIDVERFVISLVEERQDLHGVDAEFLDVIKAGFHRARARSVGGPALMEARVLLAVGLGAGPSG